MLRKGVIFCLAVCCGFYIFYSLKPGSSAKSGKIDRNTKKLDKNEAYLPKSNMLSFSGGEFESEARTVERKPDEWEGMLAPKFHPPCQIDADCGLAMACVDGICGGCVIDDDCDQGEGCVLEHCVLEDQIECRSRTECEKDSLCVLSSYSEGTRGNSDMRAFCRATSGGTEQVEDLAEQKLFENASGPRPQNQIVNELEHSKDLRYEAP